MRIVREASTSWSAKRKEHDLLLSIREVACGFTGHLPILNERKGVKSLKIRRVHFSDMLPSPMGSVLDRHFANKGWELQSWGNGQTEEYHVCFGDGVQVDNLYDYGFPHLHDKESLLAFAKNYYDKKLHRKIVVEKLSSSNRRRLFRKLEQSELTLSEPAQITMHDDVFYKRQDSLWYGGAVATISYRKWKFELYACGDVYADLYDRQEDRLLSYVKDKNNAGLLCGELLPHISSDKALRAAISGTHTKYTLSLQNNNWWEAFAYDPAGHFHDLMWCLDSDALLDAIVETLAGMDEAIEEEDYE